MEWLNKPESISNLAGVCVIIFCTGVNTSCLTYCSRYREPCPRKAFQLKGSK